MKRKKLVILFLTVLIFVSITNNPTKFALGESPAVRHYIGDEDPTNFALGDGESPKEAMKRNTDILPGLFPKEENLLNELNWIKYPFENYYFKTASSKDKGFFQNKIEDVGAVITDQIATIFLIFEIGFSTLGNNIVLVCFHDYWNDGIYTFIGNIAGLFVSGLQGNNIVGLLFIIALIILGISLASYLLKAQVMKAFTAIVTSAICIAFFLGYLTIISSLLPGVISFVNNFSGAALVATHYLKDMPMDPDKTAPTPPTELGSVTNNPLTSGLIEATNACWQATVAGPWAAAQFGYSNPNMLKLSDKEIKAINDDYNAVVKWKGLLPDVNFSVLLPGRKETIPSPAYMDTVWLASSGGARETILDAITNPSLKDGNDRRTFATAGCGQSSATHHLITSLVMFPAVLLFFIFTLLVGIPVFVAQFILILLLIIMPLALILGASGDKGINLLRKYISALLGCLATKIIYGFYLGLILFFAVSMTSFPDVQDKPGLLAFLMAIIFAVGIKYRKPFYEQIVALLSLAPETAGEKASSWLGSTAKTFAYAYMFSKLRGDKSRPNNDDDPPGGGGGGGNPPPPGGGGGNNNNNDNDNNNNDNDPPPGDDEGADLDPPPGDDTSDDGGFDNDPPPWEDIDDGGFDLEPSPWNDTDGNNDSKPTDVSGINPEPTLDGGRYNGNEGVESNTQPPRGSNGKTDPETPLGNNTSGSNVSKPTGAGGSVPESTPNGNRTNSEKPHDHSNDSKKPSEPIVKWDSKDNNRDTKNPNPVTCPTTPIDQKPNDNNEENIVNRQTNPTSQSVNKEVRDKTPNVTPSRSEINNNNRTSVHVPEQTLRHTKPTILTSELHYGKEITAPLTPESEEDDI